MFNASNRIARGERSVYVAVNVLLKDPHILQALAQERRESWAVTTKVGSHFSRGDEL